MSYTFRTYAKVSPRKTKLLDIHRGVSSAQLGGLIAHAIEDVDVFYVDDDVVGTIMHYKKKGL